MALPAPNLQPTWRDLIVDTMKRWSRDVVQLKGRIDWQVYAFDVNDALDEDGDLMTMIAAFASDTAYETLFAIHPDRHAMSARSLASFVARLNARLAGVPSLADLRAFEAHPDTTRRSPFPGFQVLSHALLPRT